MIEVVACGLKELLNDVVFVGGAVTSLYIDDPAAIYIRPTKDVDCIIELTGRQEFSKFESNLRSKGFHNVINDDAPICRWVYNDILVDVMPTDEKILGFSNPWYKDGLSNLLQATLPKDTEISILSLPYFIATKLEAFHGRKEKDFRLSHDIEDIIIILDGILNLDKLYNAPEKVKIYLAEQFREFLGNNTFTESVSSHIEQGKSPARTKRIMDFLNNFAEHS